MTSLKTKLRSLRVEPKRMPVFSRSCNVDSLILLEEEGSGAEDPPYCSRRVGGAAGVDMDNGNE